LTEEGQRSEGWLAGIEQFERAAARCEDRTVSTIVNRDTFWWDGGSVGRDVEEGSQTRVGLGTGMSMGGLAGPASGREQGR